MKVVLPFLALLAIVAFKVHNCAKMYLPPPEKLDFLDGIIGKMQVRKAGYQ
jgi:hypothetical protein